MGEPRSASPPPPPPPPLPISLVQPSRRKRQKPKMVRMFRSVFRSLPIITPSCRFPAIPATEGGHHHHHHHHQKSLNSVNSGAKVSGTLYGRRKGRVSLAVQENPKCLPSMVVELSMQTSALQKEIANGMVRIALECEKRGDKDKTKIAEEPLWTMYCNGKKCGYGVRREATEEDLYLMELLKAVSMGAGMLPLRPDLLDDAGEVAYMRAPYEHVVGSRDSETLYMLSPDQVSSGPDITIFFVRI